MPGTVQLFDFDGESSLPDAEEVNTSSSKVRIYKGKAFHFFLKEIQKKQIENAPDMKQKIYKAKEYASDAIKQFAAGADAACGALFTRAGHYLDDNGSAITLDADYAKEIFAYMKAKFRTGRTKCAR